MVATAETLRIPQEVWRTARPVNEPDLSGPFAWRRRLGVFMSYETDTTTQFWVKGEKVVLVDKDTREISIGQLDKEGEAITRPDGFSGNYSFHKTDKKNVHDLQLDDLNPKPQNV